MSVFHEEELVHLGVILRDPRHYQLPPRVIFKNLISVNIMGRAAVKTWSTCPLARAGMLMYACNAECTCNHFQLSEWQAQTGGTSSLSLTSCEISCPIDLA